jgi:hypothetical protein
MPAGCDPKTDRDHRSRLQLQIRVIRSLPAVALAKEGYPWLITQKRSAGRSYPPGAVFSLRLELFPVLLRGEPELDTAVFENDHERVGVTRVQIATVHVNCQRSPCILDPLYSRRKRAIELSAVRSNFYFVTFYFSASSSTCFSCDV